MRERLDCAVLVTQCNEPWARLESIAGSAGRLHLQPLCKSIDTTIPGSVMVLSMHTMQLKRFDACLLAVSESNLAWTRTMLSASEDTVRTPVVAVTQGLKACALNDLCALGIADFLRHPLCLDELRVRIERLLEQKRSGLSRYSPVAPSRESVVRDYASVQPSATTAKQICDTILERSGAELEAFAISSASRYATTSESFKRAKGQVIERFERAYITAALSRHAGNIAMAARSAQKHRRAFWALMRKHNIDASPYRPQQNTKPVLDG